MESVGHLYSIDEASAVEELVDAEEFDAFISNCDLPSVVMISKKICASVDTVIPASSARSTAKLLLDIGAALGDHKIKLAEMLNPTEDFLARFSIDPNSLPKVIVTEKQDTSEVKKVTILDLPGSFLEAGASMPENGDCSETTAQHHQTVDNRDVQHRLLLARQSACKSAHLKRVMLQMRTQPLQRSLILWKTHVVQQRTMEVWLFQSKSTNRKKALLTMILREWERLVTKRKKIKKSVQECTRQALLSVVQKWKMLHRLNRNIQACLEERKGETMQIVQELNLKFAHIQKASLASLQLRTLRKLLQLVFDRWDDAVRCRANAKQCANLIWKARNNERRHRMMQCSLYCWKLGTICANSARSAASTETTSSSRMSPSFQAPFGSNNHHPNQNKVSSLSSFIGTIPSPASTIATPEPQKISFVEENSNNSVLSSLFHNAASRESILRERAVHEFQSRYQNQLLKYCLELWQQSVAKQNTSTNSGIPTQYLSSLQPSIAHIDFQAPIRSMDVANGIVSLFWRKRRLLQMFMAFKYAVLDVKLSKTGCTCNAQGHCYSVQRVETEKGCANQNSQNMIEAFGQLKRIQAAISKQQQCESSWGVLTAKEVAQNAVLRRCEIQDGLLLSRYLHSWFVATARTRADNKVGDETYHALQDALADCEYHRTCAEDMQQQSILRCKKLEEELDQMHQHSLALQSKQEQAGDMQHELWILRHIFHIWLLETLHSHHLKQIEKEKLTLCQQLEVSHHQQQHQLLIALDQADKQHSQCLEQQHHEIQSLKLQLAQRSEELDERVQTTNRVLLQQFQRASSALLRKAMDGWRRLSNQTHLLKRCMAIVVKKTATKAKKNVFSNWYNLCRDSVLESMVEKNTRLDQMVGEKEQLLTELQKKSRLRCAKVMRYSTKKASLRYRCFIYWRIWVQKTSRHILQHQVASLGRKQALTKKFQTFQIWRAQTATSVTSNVMQKVVYEREEWNTLKIHLEDRVSSAEALVERQAEEYTSMSMQFRRHKMQIAGFVVRNSAHRRLGRILANWHLVSLRKGMETRAMSCILAQKKRLSYLRSLLRLSWNCIRSLNDGKGNLQKQIEASRELEEKSTAEISVAKERTLKAQHCALVCCESRRYYKLTQKAFSWWQSCTQTTAERKKMTRWQRRISKTLTAKLSRVSINTGKERAFSRWKQVLRSQGTCKQGSCPQMEQVAALRPKLQALEERSVTLERELALKDRTNRENFAESEKYIREMNQQMNRMQQELLTCQKQLNVMHEEAASLDRMVSFLSQARHMDRDLLLQEKDKQVLLLKEQLQCAHQRLLQQEDQVNGVREHIKMLEMETETAANMEQAAREELEKKLHAAEQALLLMMDANEKLLSKK